jgi:hypothetical protein
VANFLAYMHHTLQTKQRVAMTEELKARCLSHDYIIIMIKEGIFERVESGKRGPTYYIWNKEHLPDMQTAFKLVMAYNKLRLDQQRLRETANPRQTNTVHLLEIKEVVMQILNKLENNRK